MGTQLEPWFYKLGAAIFEDGTNRYLVAKKKLPRLLYHYTSISGLAGMINTAQRDQKEGRVPFSTLWLTNLRTLNDDLEGVSAVNKVISKLAAICDVEEDDLKDFETTAIESFLDNSFVISFTTKRDDLSLWKAYGGVDVGICLGFDLQEYVSVQEDANLVRVSYIDEERSVINDKEFWSMINMKFISLRSESNLPSSDFAKTFCSAVIAFFSVLHSPSCKDSCHAYENEFRILATTDFKGLLSEASADNHDGLSVIPSDVFVEARSQFLVERLILQSNVKQSPLKEIIISPAGKGVKNKKAISMSLSRLGVSPEIEISELSVSR